MNEVETAEGRKLVWRREAIDILVDMLVVASPKAGKIDIVYRTNLNFRVVRKYLGFLMQKGLIEADGVQHTSKSYRTTEKGRLFIKLYKQTVELIS